MTASRQRILMCAPDFFTVSYVINPWMEGHIENADQKLARQQWGRLRGALAEHADILIQPPQKGLPDLVFTANAALVLGKKAIISRFRNKERQGEEPHDLAWFEANGFEICDWPKNVAFEGAGDALFDREQSLLWIGHGFRSDINAPPLVEKLLGRRTVVLNMIDPHFYHLDTCLCPLPGGYLMYYPDAFDEASRALIEETVQDNKRIAVHKEDAIKFCCNAVDLNKFIYLNDASDSLQTRLRGVGFTPVVTPLSEFMKAGGAAKCLTLKLVED